MSVLAKKVNWIEYFRLKYGIEPLREFKADRNDPNFDLPLANLYIEY
jgi:hypothetical protein